jgi:Flp pilus assembly protein TadD
MSSARPHFSVRQPVRSSRAGLGFAVCLAALALAGCQGRGPGDITGSIGRSSQASQPRTASDWQADRETWAKRYDANPKDRDAAFYYARALRSLDQNAQALAVLQNAVLIHQDDRELLGAYGRTLADNGRFQEADDVLSRAHSPERPDWRILSAQGTVADQLGDHNRAQQIYQSALKLAPNEPTIMSNYGLSLALSRKLPEAERVLAEAAASDRADARVRQNLVLVLGLQGRFGEAETLARRDQSPAEAAQTIAYLKRSVSQQNSWELLKGGKGRAQSPARPSPVQGAGAQSAAAPPA